VSEAQPQRKQSNGHADVGVRKPPQPMRASIVAKNQGIDAILLKLFPVEDKTNHV
jgi:hypothetical protein